MRTARLECSAEGRRTVCAVFAGRAGSLIAFALSAAVLASACALADPAAASAKAAPSAAEARPEPPATLHFAELGGIRNWHVLREGGLLIEGQRQQFYLATFFGSCPRLRSAETVGFVTDATGSLTQFDSIIVDGEQCRFRTLQRVPPEMAENMR